MFVYTYRRCFHEVMVVKKNCIHFALRFSSLPSLRENKDDIFQCVLHKCHFNFQWCFFLRQFPSNVWIRPLNNHMDIYGQCTSCLDCKKIVCMIWKKIHGYYKKTGDKMPLMIRWFQNNALLETLCQCNSDFILKKLTFPNNRLS